MMHNYSNKIFIILFFFFPLSFILGSFVVNLTIFLLLIIFTFEVIISKDFYIFNKKLFIVSVIFVTYTVIITYLNNDLTHTLKAFFLLRFFLLPLIFYYFFQRIDFDKKKILFYYTSILIFLSLDLLFQRIFNFNFLGFKPSLWNESYQLFERYAGFFDQELIAGGYLVNFGIISLIIYVSIFNYTKKNLTIFFSIFTFVLIGLYITGDRAPVIILLSFILLAIIFLKKIRIILIPIFSILIVCFIIGINLSDMIKHRFIDYPYDIIFKENKALKSNENHTYKKIFINNSWGKHYLVGFEMISAKPYFGHGLKSFRKYCKDYNYVLDVKLKSLNDTKIIKSNGCSTHPHNYIIEIVVDTGLIGLILILSIIFLAFQLAFKTTSNKLYLSSMIIFMMALMSPFKPSGSFFSSWTSTMLWFMIALIYLFIKKKKT